MLFFLLNIIFCNIEDAVLHEINKYRLEKKLSPLNKSIELENAAKIQAKFMKKTNTMSHFGKEGKNHTLLQRIQNSKYEYLKELGEYIVLDNTEKEYVVMKEIKKQNKKNGFLDHGYEDVGISHFTSKSGKSFWVIVFASKFEKDLIEMLK